MSQISGVIVPSIIFYNENDQIDFELTSIIFQHIRLNGANAILLFNTMEEYNSDDLENKINLIKTSFDTIKKKIHIMVGLGGSDSNQIIDQIDNLKKRFELLNFVVAPPFSESVAPDKIKSYFENIFESTNLDTPVYLYNNPELFSGNKISHELLNNLLKYKNFKGIIDGSEKISNYKFYSELLSESFSAFCSNPAMFSTFLQVIPLERRTHCGIVASLGNLVNICSKLYQASHENNILNLVQQQEKLLDIREKIYLKFEKGRRSLGLEYAFLYLYKNLLSIDLDNVYKEFDKTTKGRIEAIMNSLLNENLIYQLFTLDKKAVYDFNEIIEIFSVIPVLNDLGKIKKIRGPLEGSNNRIFNVKFEDTDVIFRFRTNKSFKFEDVIKEKVFFPLLAGINPSFSKKIIELIETPKGSFVFNKQNPPIIPVADLLYFDESKEIVPYNFTIMKEIKGNTLSQIIEHYLSESKIITTSKFLNLFYNLGEMLAKIHQIKFDAFYEKITDIGTKKKRNWYEIFEDELEHEFQSAKKNKLEFIDEIKTFIDDNEALLENENEPVLIHNDYQAKNFIVSDDATFKFNGLIDFDEWRVGPRALDFIKMNYWTLNHLNEIKLNEAFKKGYSDYSKIEIDENFNKKIEIYTIFWLLQMYNQNINKMIKKGAEKIEDIQSITSEVYLYEIKKIIKA